MKTHDENMMKMRQEHSAENYISVTKTFKAKKSQTPLLKFISLYFLQIDLIQTHSENRFFFNK